MSTGVLTGTGGSDKARFAKIGDKEYEVLDFVIRYLDKCPVGSEVEYELTESKDGKPQKIKRIAPARNGGGSCTSPATVSPPASGEKPAAIEGEIAAIDPDAKKLQIVTPDNNFVPLMWVNCPDMARQKPGWYNKFTIQDGQVIAVTKVERPQGFRGTSGKKGSGWGGGKPRNEKLITYQCCYKEACETARALILQSSETMDEAEYNRVMDIALERAKKDAKALIDAAGGN